MEILKIQPFEQTLIREGVDLEVWLTGRFIPYQSARPKELEDFCVPQGEGWGERWFTRSNPLRGITTLRSKSTFELPRQPISMIFDNSK